MARDQCDGCGEPAEEALTRSLELQVDGAEVDRQRLCPSCFAEWIDRYQQEMSAGVSDPATDDESSTEDIIVD
jgi:hypothetical protein